MVLATTKCRDVAAQWYVDRDRAPGALAGVVACEGPAKPRSLDANNWIYLGVKALAAPKSLDADGVALDTSGFAAEHRFHHETEKRHELGRTTEAGTGYNVLNGAANLFRRGNVTTVVRGCHWIGLFSCWRKLQLSGLLPGLKSRVFDSRCLFNNAHPIHHE
jgi:hypothetical protein